MIGIGKRQLMEDYYPDELPAIFEAWGEMHGVEGKVETEEVDPLTFFGAGGEIIE